VSVTSIEAGGTLVLDPSDKRVISFNWDDVLPDGVALAGSAWTIAAIVQSGETALTNDNAAYVAAARTTSTRLLATTASEGDAYWVSNKITTDETPAQEIEQRFKVLIQDQ
jgi:hypothetical protein